MLELHDIKKSYVIGDTVTEALKGISINFRENEFVAILGQSGCGKTTLLNVIGGLDKYDSGDLIISGRSTKEYKDADWDAYRNHSIGFVFQSYNLIPHQTVLQNVELALSLCGVSKAERKARAAKALEDVGLADHLYKKPSEMSGGQMQRVAIARALVNNPDIILADEPTGALDSETSLQVMDILKEVAKDRLVIMVTHNPELAEKYATRTIKMLDGVVISDSAPLTESEIKEEQEKSIARNEKTKKIKRPSMSFATSFGLSLKNLFTKKGRTMLTSFAGSIGIIGIALIFAVSQGMSNYINAVQEDTLTSYPLTLEATTLDMTSLMQSFMGVGSNHNHEKDAVYKDPIIGDLVNALSELDASENDLNAFKAHLESEINKEGTKLNGAVSGVQYTYNLNFAVYTKNTDGKIIKSDTNKLMMEMLGDFMMQITSNNKNEESTSNPTGSMSSTMMTGMASASMWQELLPDLHSGDPVNSVLKDQYDVLHGDWPKAMNEVVLVVNENNELDDLTLYAIGLLSEKEIDAIIDAAASGNTLSDDNKKWSYEEICGKTFKTIMPYDCYREFDGIYKDISENDSMLQMLYDDALELKIVGIIRPSEEAESAMLTGAIGYTHLLTEHIIKEASNSDVVKAQLTDPSTDILTGLPFEANTGAFTDEEKADAFRDYLSDLDTKQKADVYIAIQALKAVNSQMQTQVDGILATMTDKNAIIEQISTAISTQMGVDPESVKSQLEDMELEALKDMMKPSIEESVKLQITAAVEGQFANIPAENIAALLDQESPSFTTEECALYYDEVTVFSENTYDQVLIKIGSLDLDSPATINLYASTFENKDLIVEAIAEYNDSVEEAKKIAYTDFLGIMMASITTIINAITYVLIAFVAISLIVSSIMIGVITLISVQERTKEIGILRAIGASKKNVSRMFNAETVIIGFTSGLLGVLITYLLCIPINAIIFALTDIVGLKAQLPIGVAIALIIISVILTLFAGIIPSRSAAKKDPVVALRTE